MCRRSCTKATGFANLAMAGAAEIQECASCALPLRILLLMSYLVKENKDKQSIHVYNKKKTGGNRILNNKLWGHGQSNHRLEPIVWGPTV